MNRLQPFSPAQFKQIYSQVPRLCVDIIIKIDDKILLTLRESDGWQGQWHIPGGTVFYKETIEEAIHRIAQEELDIDVDIEKLLGYLEYPSEEKERGFGWSVGLAFFCTPQESLKIEETTTIQLFNKLPENVVEEQRELLNQVLQNTK